MSPEEFVKTFKPYAKIIYGVFGIPWRAILAQAALETGWLRKPVTDLETGRNSYNLFNIKGRGSAGSVRAYDDQYINGRPVKRIHEFRAYHSYDESFEDYARLITENPRYQKALAVAEDPEAYVRRIQQAGFAEDPRYAAKLIQIMRKYIKDEEEPVD
jgi:flagellar protein FlgJ